MTQPRILIESHHGKELGTELRAILQWRDRYKVDSIDGPLADRKKVSDPRPDLIIPVLPACQVAAGHLLDTLRKGAANTPLLPVLRAADLDGMLEALFRWTADFLVTPLKAGEVLARVNRLLGSRARERTDTKSSTTEALGLAHLVGEDPALVAVKRLLPLIARRDAPVLLIGETGTGKELCARALHYLSPRARRPFLPVNCGAIPVELFERELFGHHQGAFTGAGSAQPGFVAEAEGGTLFLDEIESLGLGAQAKLLRFVEDQRYHALGSARTKQADVRILAATNVELSHRVQDRTFREDLFYRLAVLNLTLPPLRERRGDIPLLAAHLWSRYSDRDGQPARRLSARAMGALCAYAWPGNVRELENVLQQVLLLTDAETIEPEHLPIPHATVPEKSPGASWKQSKAQVIAYFEKDYLTQLLRAHQGNVTQAAQAARTGRRALGRLIKKHQLARC
jgi:two-component system, NtrC family, response regulator GlrR